MTLSKRTLLGLSLLGAVGVSATGCGPLLHREMLGESIQAFSSSRGKAPPTEKIWITSAGDSNNCDSGCNLGSSCKDKGGGGGGGGLLGMFGGAKKPGSSPQDGLAYEVFANYFTQRRKAKVVESHRHNYSTELNPETHRKIEFMDQNNKVSTSSCEDLCLLDEAKKRKADKVLV